MAPMIMAAQAQVFRSIAESLRRGLSAEMTARINSNAEL